MVQEPLPKNTVGYPVFPFSDLSNAVFVEEATRCFLKMSQYTANFKLGIKFTEADLIVDANDDVLALMKKNRTKDLPVFLNSQVFRSIIVETVRGEWHPTSSKLLENIEKVVTDFLNQAHGMIALENKNYPKFISKLKKDIDAAVRKCVDKCEKGIAHCLKLEESPFTNDPSLLQSVQRERFKKLSLQIKQLDQQDGRVNTASVLQLISDCKDKPIDVFCAEDMLIILHAYGEIAMRRVCDSVAQHVEEDFVSALCESNEFFEATDEMLNSYFSQAPAVEARQRVLHDSIKNLERVQEYVREFNF
jgi:hypothetical protein